MCSFSSTSGFTQILLLQKHAIFTNAKMASSPPPESFAIKRWSSAMVQVISGAVPPVQSFFVIGRIHSKFGGERRI